MDACHRYEDDQTSAASVPEVIPHVSKEDSIELHSSNDNTQDLTLDESNDIRISTAQEDLIAVSNRNLTQTKPGRCFQQPLKGNCAGSYERWYYRASENRCMMFHYGGCGGNENNFGSRTSCIETCGNAQQAFLSIEEGPASVSSSIGGTARLPCVARGEPQLSVTWTFQNGSEINNNRIFTETDNTLVVNEIIEDDGGGYICYARNGVGYEESRQVVLIVTDSLLFIETPVDTSIEKGETVVMRCRVSSDVVFLTWHKSGVQIVNGKYGVYKK